MWIWVKENMLNETGKHFHKNDNLFIFMTMRVLSMISENVAIKDSNNLIGVETKKELIDFPEIVVLNISKDNGVEIDPFVNGGIMSFKKSFFDGKQMVMEEHDKPRLCTCAGKTIELKMKTVTISAHQDKLHLKDGIHGITLTLYARGGVGSGVGTGSDGAPESEDGSGIEQNNVIKTSEYQPYATCDLTLEHIYQPKADRQHQYSEDMNGAQMKFEVCYESISRIKLQCTENQNLNIFLTVGFNHTIASRKYESTAMKHHLKFHKNRFDLWNVLSDNTKIRERVIYSFLRNNNYNADKQAKMSIKEKQLLTIRNLSASPYQMMMVGVGSEFGLNGLDCTQFEEFSKKLATQVVETHFPSLMSAVCASIVNVTGRQCTVQQQMVRINQKTPEELHKVLHMFISYQTTANSNYVSDLSLDIETILSLKRGKVKLRSKIIADGCGENMNIGNTMNATPTFMANKRSGELYLEIDKLYELFPKHKIDPLKTSWNDWHTEIQNQMSRIDRLQALLIKQPGDCEDSASGTAGIHHAFMVATEVDPDGQQRGLDRLWKMFISLDRRNTFHANFDAVSCFLNRARLAKLNGMGLGLVGALAPQRASNDSVVDNTPQNFQDLMESDRVGGHCIGNIPTWTHSVQLKQEECQLTYSGIRNVIIFEGTAATTELSDDHPKQPVKLVIRAENKDRNNEIQQLGGNMNRYEACNVLGFVGSQCIENYNLSCKSVMKHMLDKTKLDFYVGYFALNGVPCFTGITTNHAKSNMKASSVPKFRDICDSANPNADPLKGETIFGLHYPLNAAEHSALDSIVEASIKTRDSMAQQMNHHQDLGWTRTPHAYQGWHSVNGEHVTGSDNGPENPDFAEIMINARLSPPSTRNGSQWTWHLEHQARAKLCKELDFCEFMHLDMKTFIVKKKLPMLGNVKNEFE